MSTSGALPLHPQISETMIRDINAGRLVDGERLPPERDMAASHGITVGHVAQGAGDLAAKGAFGEGARVRQQYPCQGGCRIGPCLSVAGTGGRERLSHRAGAAGGPASQRPAPVAFRPSPEGHRIRRLRFLSGKAAAVEAVNCLLIASPNHLHLPQLEKITATRPLPVLVEKPLFTDPADPADPADAPRLARLRHNCPAPIWVAMEYGYMPPVAHLIEQVQAATGGLKMLTIREHRFPFLEKVGDWNRLNRNTGGTLLEKCCHFFDFMRLIAGSDALRVMA